MAQSTSKKKRFEAPQLQLFATRILEKGGLASDRATTVATTLLASDLMGHPTHGLALLSPYAQSLENGDMTTSGGPEVLKDTGAAITWDGRLLPGAWLVHQSIDLALERIKEHPVVTMAIQQSHHIGCLAAYPERATEQGLMMILACSDPAYNRVAPYGGLTGVYSPNPIAAGIPTKGEPIVFDISTSATAGGVVGQAHKLGVDLPHPWLLTSDGEATTDPTTFYTTSPSTILPLGGLDTGYKGFALGLLVEALTGALSGHGRSHEPTKWMSSVFLQIIAPEHFGGLDAFTSDSQYVVDKSKAAATRPGDPPVRLPGQRAFRMREEQLAHGVQLNPAIVSSLEKLAEQYGIDCPAAIQ